MTSPFAPRPDTDSTPFGDDDDLAIEMPDTPVGVLSGHIVEAKNIMDRSTGKPKGCIIEIKCDDPAYADAQNASIWLGPGEFNVLRTIAAEFGVMCESGVNSKGKTVVIFVDDNGTRGLAAFKDKPGMFVYAPYQSKTSLARYGLPKKGSSPEWDRYAEEANFTDEQIAVLKKAERGIVPGDKLDLFR